ncbi:MAG: hypothetical protein M3004_08625 [Bacteroidota bacterium]|nr:hypothetical protein [Bacteroidota bacterium]
MGEIVLTREELYNLVWSTPMLTLSKKYNISDVGLRKICKRMNIPLPQAGHWQKLQFGKKIITSPLPDNYKGEQQISLALRNGDASQDVNTRYIVLSLQNEIEENLKSKLIVPERLSNPDKLINAVKDSMSTRRVDDSLYISTVRSWRDELDIRVGKLNLGRALRFFDTLIKALRARGHDVLIKNGDTYAVIDEQDFKILFREKMKKVVTKDGSWDRMVYHPTGILSFQVYRYPNKEWKDGKETIEQQLSKIIAYLEIAGMEEKERRIQHKKDEQIRKEKERLKQEFELLQEKELLKFKELLGNASRWHKAKNLRNYIKEVEKKDLGDTSANLKEWLEWARNKADWYDPFIESKDVMLDDVVDKETLILKRKSSTDFRYYVH